MPAPVDLVGTAFDGWGRPGNQALAAAALRDAGVVAAVGAADTGDVDLPAADPGRGPATGLLNESALLVQTRQLAARVDRAIGAGRFPLVVGGDCSVLLGALRGLRHRRGTAALVAFDGHEDTMPLDVSEDGEAANAEIGLLLGLTGRTPGNPLVDGPPVLVPQRLALLGVRDAAWRRRFNVASLRDLGVHVRDPEAIAADPGPVAAAAVAALQGASGWWLHVDVDVLDPAVFPAQGLPDYPDEPGGLLLEQLHAALVAAVAVGGCVGMSASIYDPDQDPDGSGAVQVVELVRAALAARPG